MVSVDAEADAACALAPMGAMHTVSCAAAAIHVLKFSAQPSRFLARARLGLGVDSACAQINEVSIVRRQTELQRASGPREVALHRDDALVAEGSASATLEQACDDESERLVAYGMILRGVDAMGPFEARCGAAESGGGYPPSAYLACHFDVDAPVVGGNFTLTNLGATTSVVANMSVEHAEGQRVFLSVNRAVRMVSPQTPPRWRYPMLASADTTGWINVTVMESMRNGRFYTDIAYEGVGPPGPFAQGVCADRASGELPAYFLARIAGPTDHNVIPATSELFTYCVVNGR